MKLRLTLYNTVHVEVQDNNNIVVNERLNTVHEKERKKRKKKNFICPMKEKKGQKGQLCLYAIWSISYTAVLFPT